MTAFNVFRPTDGAILDHCSLQAIADTPNRLLSAYLDSLTPNTPNMVLYGLEMVGEMAAGGPPGAVCPTAEEPGTRFTPGAAILSDSDGRKFLLEVKEGLWLPWPFRNGPAIQAALALVPQVDDVDIRGGISVARAQVKAKLGFVDLKVMDKPMYLPLAASVGNGQDWATDFRRIYQPSHPVIQLLIKRFEKLERTVWQAEPEGEKFSQAVIGKNWFRYQTIGAAALQAVRSLLLTYPTTTMDRVHLLKTLRIQLQDSVPQAATELIQLVGSRDGAGPYVDVLPQVTGV
jgi:hypothetical protein